jgi:hypothetical protein
VSDDLTRDLAVRLAITSKFMGLDDQDEKLLWRYVAGLKDGDKPDQAIVDVLVSQAEMSPIMVTGYTWVASMPERFYKKRQQRLARWGFPLRQKKTVRLDQPQYVTDAGAYTDSLDTSIKRQCFEQWFPHLTSCLRPDGLNWEPPGDLDVVLQLKINSVSLYDRLQQFV